MDLDEGDFWKAVHRLSVLQKRRGDLESAIAWWEQAAAQGHIYAHVELAKHYEHREKDLVEARKWAQDALEHVTSSELPDYIREHWQAELEHRLERLDRKLDSKPKRR
jgi:hypothetical protein